MSPKNDCFMSGALDHTVRLWDLRTNVCQVNIFSLHFRLHHFCQLVACVPVSLSCPSWYLEFLGFDLSTAFLQVLAGIDHAR